MPVECLITIRVPNYLLTLIEHRDQYQLFPYSSVLCFNPVHNVDVAKKHIASRLPWQQQDP